MDDIPSWGGVDEDIEGEEEQAKEYEFRGRDAIILLIDCSKDMFIQTDEGNAFEISMKCARNALTNKIISSEKDLVGIVFFGTEISENPAGFKYITIFQELSQPGAEKIKEIDELLKSDINEIEQKYGHCDDFALSDALWTCSSMFSKSETKLGSKRIMLFTNNDDPHEHDPQLQNQAHKRAADLPGVGIDLDLMHIHKPNESFDINKFYKDLLRDSDDMKTDKLPVASGKYDELLNRFRAKNHVKRRLGALNLTLLDGMEIGIDVYSLVRSTTVPYPAKMHKDGNEMLKSMRKTYLSETGEVLFPSDIKKCTEVSGKTVTFDNEELKEIAHIYEPGLTLIGFKPRKSLKIHHYVKPSQFIYPNDSEINGSTSLFSALLTKCIDKKVFAICRYVARVNSAPILVAMIPEAEEFEDNGTQRDAPGFHLLKLPFADDLRHLGLNKSPKAEPHQIDKASKMVRKLKFTYFPDRFENPVLQTHWRNVEAFALDLDQPEEFVDLTMPDNEMITERAKKYIDEFKSSVFPEDYNPNAAKTVSSGGNRKPATQTEPVDDTDIRKRVSDGTLSKLTVPILKQFCMSVDIKVTGKKKDDLISEIIQYTQRNPA